MVTGIICCGERRRESLPLGSLEPDTKKLAIATVRSAFQDFIKETRVPQKVGFTLVLIPALQLLYAFSLCMT